MLEHPARHSLYRRARQIESLAGTPPSLRVGWYLENFVRKVSDDVAAIAAIPEIGRSQKKVFGKQQSKLARFRRAVAHLPPPSEAQSVALLPARLATRAK